MEDNPGNEQGSMADDKATKEEQELSGEQSNGVKDNALTGHEDSYSIQAEHSRESEDSESSESESETYNDTPPVSYNLKLFCSTDETKSRSTEIMIPHTPRTVLDIKLCVEKEFSIPVCCQRITFESHELRDQDSIEQLRIREGDTLSIAYTADAMVEDIKGIIDAMKAMRCFLRKSSTRRNLSSRCDPNGEISSKIGGEEVELLSLKYFARCSVKKAREANRLYFVSNNGLRVMHQLHEELLRHPWENCLLEMQHLEYAIMRVLWNISAACSLRMLLFQQPTLDAVMKSLVRVKIPADSFIQTAHGSSYMSHKITVQMLLIGGVVVGNLAEISEFRIAIASRKDVLDQLLATLTCPSFSYIASQVACAGLLCLSYSIETHEYLVTKNVIEKFDMAIKTKKHHSVKDEQLLKYFQTVFYAHLLYASASKIPLDLKLKMHEAVKEFLITANHTEIHGYEKENDFFWSTVTPFVKLAYFPKQNSRWSFCDPENTHDNHTFLQELEDMCIEIGVFSLQNILLSENTRDILIAESLVDYIVCLPWHLSPETKAYTRACDLRIFLGKKLQLQPPSLVNLTKAKLAVTHCGLDKVLKATNLHDIVNSIGY